MLNGRSVERIRLHAIRFCLNAIVPRLCTGPLYRGNNISERISIEVVVEAEDTKHADDGVEDSGTPT